MSVEKPLRIAFCITDLDPGGAERALVQLVTRLDRSQWEPHVFCLSGPGMLVAKLEEAKIPITCLGAKRAGNISVVFRLARQLRRLRPALLQTFLYHANMAGRIAGRLARVPVIVSGIRVAEKRSRFRLGMDRITRGMVHHHVCVSEAVAAFSKKNSRLSANNITVIPNGVEVDLFAHAQPADLSVFEIPDTSQTVLFVGRLDLQKDPFLLSEAMQSIINSHPEIHLMFVGEGPLKDDLRLWITQHQLEAQIHIAGWRDDVASLMKACDVFVLPSRWEGMPNVVLEAMAAGLPVVATNVEGTAELIEEGQTGLIVSPQSPTALTEAVDKLLSHPEKSFEMGRNAQRIVSQGFTWDRVVTQYEELYRCLITK